MDHNYIKNKRELRRIERPCLAEVTHHVLPPPTASTKVLEVQCGIGHLSPSANSFSKTIAILIDILGTSTLWPDIVITWSAFLALKISKFPATTSVLPGPSLNLALISASSASILHSEGKKKTRPSASSTLTGAWKNVKRVSMLRTLALSSSTMVYICCVDTLDCMLAYRPRIWACRGLELIVDISSCDSPYFCYRLTQRFQWSCNLAADHPKELFYQRGVFSYSEGLSLNVASYFPKFLRRSLDLIP